MAKDRFTDGNVSPSERLITLVWALINQLSAIFMPGRPDGSRNHSYSIFEFIRREFGQTVLQCSRKFEKIGLKISKSYCDLKFNHRCKSEDLVPKSLQFSPPIRTKRGFKLARQYSNKFLKLRITDCHIKIEQLKQVEKT